MAQSGTILILYDRDFQITYCNRAACEYIGKAKNELTGTYMGELSGTIDWENLQKSVRSQNPEKPVTIHRQKRRSATGKWNWMIWTHTSMFDQTETILGYQTIGRNATQYKKYLRNLNKTALRYKGVVEDQMELVCRYKPDCTLTFVNRAYCNQFGRSRDKLVGESILPVIKPQYQPQLLNYLKNVSPENPDATQIQCVVNDKGEQLWLEWRRRAFFDSSGKIVEIQAVGRDITERKKIEEALRLSQSELLSKNQELERKNIALQELLAQIDLNKQQVQDNIIANIDNCLLPLIKQFKLRHLDDDIVGFIDIVERNLDQLTSSFGKKITRDSLKLSPREIEISNLVTMGLTSKEIAKLLHISENTVGRHRNSIRRKAKIVNDKISLNTYLHNL